MELSPEVIVLDEGPVIFGSANLDITHHIPMGIGQIIVETSVPIQFPVKRGDKFIYGEITQDWEAESYWELTAMGDVVGATSDVLVPTTFQIRGVFEQCNFNFMIVEIMHTSQVTTMNVLALGDVPVDFGEDIKWEYGMITLTSADPKIDYQDPNVLGTITIGISNASLPPDLSMICPYPTSLD
jgi:hypothetical protein